MNEIFINEHYKVLKKIYDSTLIFGEKKYCPLSQNEIALSLKMSRSTAIKIYRELRVNGYIDKVARGKWSVTKKSEKLIIKTKSL